jgi:hypothetical protein
MRRLGTSVAVLALTLAVAMGAPSARAADDETGSPRVRPPEAPRRAGVLVPSRRFPTIQAAIDAAEDGGAIRIRPGVYREVLTITGKRVRITGAGTRGESTEIVGPRTTTVDDAATATGLVNYLEGGGGVLEGLVLRGGPNGVVGQEPSTRVAGDRIGGDGVAPAAIVGALHVADVVIQNTGRGILWRTGTSLTVRDARIARVGKHGIVFNGQGRPGPVVTLVDVAVEKASGFGVLVLNEASNGCSNQLTNVFVTFAAKGGIGVIQSGVCIVGGALSFNEIVGIYAKSSALIIDGTLIQGTIPTIVDGQETGYGIYATASELQLVSNARIWFQPVGIMAWGTPFTLAWDDFNCNGNGSDLFTVPIPPDAFGPGDPPVQIESPPTDAMGNVCRCGVVTTPCKAFPAVLAPPNTDTGE